MFELEADYVARSLRRLGVRESDVEDATHEVFVAVHARLADYDRSRPLKPWLFAFAVRVAYAERRRPHHRMDLVGTDIPEIPDERPDLQEEVEHAERRSLLLDALAAIPEDRRLVVMMHELDGIAVPEIAHALEIPLNTAYSRLRLGREDLTDAVRRLRARRGGQ